MKVEINDGHYLELFDRLNMMCNIIEQNIQTHPVHDTDSRIQSLVDKAISDLYDAYQIVGELLVQRQNNRDQQDKISY
jgi:hypothetical protein